MKKETKEKIIDAATDATSYLTGLGVAIGVFALPAGLYCSACKSKLAKVLICLGASIGGGFASVYVADKVEDSNREIIADIVELLDRRKEEVTKITEVIE